MCGIENSTYLVRGSEVLTTGPECNSQTKSEDGEWDDGVPKPYQPSWERRRRYSRGRFVEQSHYLQTIKYKKKDWNGGKICHDSEENWNMLDTCESQAWVQ